MPAGCRHLALATTIAAVHGHVLLHNVTMPTVAQMCPPVTCYCGFDASNMEDSDNHKAQRRLVFGQFDLVDVVKDSVVDAWDYISEALQMMSNLGYVIVMLVGFVYLPRPLMLFIALLTAFLPTIIISLVDWLVNAYEFSLVAAKAIADASMLVGPLIVEGTIGVVAAYIGLAATAPSVAILIAAVVAFLSSRLFQKLALDLGLDYNGDGKVGWRDLWVWLVRRLTDRSGPKTRSALGLDELKQEAQKKLRASKQNDEILGRIERIEAMLLALGAPDLRAEQQSLAVAGGSRDGDTLDGLLASETVHNCAAVSRRGPAAAALAAAKTGSPFHLTPVKLPAPRKPQASLAQVVASFEA